MAAGCTSSFLAIVIYDQDEAERLAATIGREHVETLSKRGLDGGIAEWIVIVTLASRAIHAAAALALRYIELTRVRSIHVRDERTGLDVKVDSPTRDDVERLIAAAAGQHPDE